ncbi:MAG: class I SAM-dependent methyltransferase [Myxococcales bacterium]|nr:class I SAM-dependent methyltransferase [Myxococcales bacterium]
MKIQPKTPDALTRFSKTVDNYVRYRPGYPTGVVDFMRAELGLTQRSVVADLGAGTGKLTELFLENGNLTYAVEPNADMRAALERLYQHFKNARSIDATAKASNLPDHGAEFGCPPGVRDPDPETGSDHR